MHIFQAPLPAPSWKGILNATTKNVVCPQHLNHQLPKIYDMKINCLHINVFTPAKENAIKLPVVMYIHGGAYKQGYGNEITPNNLVKNDVIVVNFNYRVGVHGFLCLGTEFAPGNAAFKDKVAALRWIKENIPSFSGDPDNISVVGNSAGASSVEFLILSKITAGLFHKVISESGSAVSSWAITDFPIDTAEHYANQFGIHTNKNITALENFYKKLNVDDLKVTYKSSKVDNLGFVACVEKDLEKVESFLNDKPLNILKSGNYNKVDYITGFTSMEGILFLEHFNDLKFDIDNNFALLLPKDLVFQNIEEKQNVIKNIKDFYFPNGAVHYDNFVSFWTDVIFGYPSILSARLHRRFEPVYVYIFSFNGTLRLPNTLLKGPGHVATAMYVQEFSYGVGYDQMTSNDFLIRDRMITLWTNFFKYG